MDMDAEVEKLKTALRFLALVHTRETSGIMCIIVGAENRPSRAGTSYVPEDMYVKSWQIAYDLLHEKDALPGLPPTTKP